MRALPILIIAIAALAFVAWMAFVGQQSGRLSYADAPLAAEAAANSGAG